MYNPFFRNDCGRQIRRLRTDNQWTQKDLAHKCGITPSYVSQLELGKVGLTEELRNALIKAFGMNVA